VNDDQLQEATALTMTEMPGIRSSILKLLAVFVLVHLLDKFIRPSIVKTPDEILQSLSLRDFKRRPTHLTMEERALYIKENCNSSTLSTHSDSSQRSEVFYNFKSTQAGVRSLFVCLPRRMATKAVYNMLNQAYSNYCDKEREACRSAIAGTDALKVVFTRHPLDRLIIGYRHQKHSETDNSPRRKLLFSRHRAIGKKGRRGKHHFAEYLRTTVIQGRAILPITQECDVCGYEYDLVYDLDQGLDELKVIQNLTGAQLNPRKELKKPAVHTRRRFFAELAAEEIEGVANMFRNDFNFLGYNANFYE